MELGEITICLEDVQKVEGQLNRLFVIVPQCATDSSKESLMLEHDLHVFVAETQIQNTLCSLGLLINLLLIKHLNIVIQVFDVHFVKIYFFALKFEK